MSHFNQDVYATPHFKWVEFGCHHCGFYNVQEEALWKLEEMRRLIGKPFSPLSASRCPIHNARVGGAPLSQHKATETLQSCAFDIPLIIPKKDLIGAAEQVGFRGLGVNYKTFMHMDNRLKKARW
jgi:zinc D-Ala-D-Ala carboxypeptidase